jgi:hypothetical protein
MAFNDARFLTTEVIDAYLEMVLGIMCLRIENVQDFLITNFPTAAVISSYPGENLNIDVKRILNEFKKEGLKDVKSLQKSFKQVNKIFLIAMWDIIFNHQSYPKICVEPEVQFLRRIRNACAHTDGKITDSIDKKAKWREIEITNSDKDKDVFTEILKKPADPLLLIIDINNKFFHPVDLNKK